MDNTVKDVTIVLTRTRVRIAVRMIASSPAHVHAPAIVRTLATMRTLNEASDHCPRPATQKESMKEKATPTPTRPTRNDAQRQSILDAASVLFIEKGFGGTNINDIADAVGVTRTALYYYFPSKESMLEALTKDVTETAGQLAKTASSREEVPPDAALRQLILQHAGLILDHPLQFRVVERSESSLPEPGRSAAQAARRAVLDHFVQAIQRGIDGGQFRATDAHVAAFSIIGMCNWCAWWFDPQGPVKAHGVATLIAEFALRALLSDKPRRARATTVDDAMEQMREAMGALETKLKRFR